MSIQAVSWVLQHSEATLGARLVLLAIANHADAQGRNSYPSIAQLAAEARLSDRQVQRAIRTLERQGELTIVVGRGRHGTHLFSICGISGDNMSPVNMSPGVTNRASRGDKSGQQHVRNVTRTVKRTVLEPEVREAGASSPHLPAVPEPRGTRLPPDWQPGPADLAYSDALGLIAADVAERFRDYWHARAGPGARKASWSLTWKTWCRREAENRRSNGHKQSPVEKLYEGAYRAVQAYNRKHGLDSELGVEADVPLLDGGRSGGRPAGTA